jgi:isopentenyldiphosphate isomerase
MTKKIVVDENDEGIALKDRLDDLSFPEKYRISGLWLTNSKGQILMTKRGADVEESPGVWAPAGFGVVEHGEDYNVNIARELDKQLGLSGITINRGWSRLPTEKHPFFVQWYTGKLDRDPEAFNFSPQDIQEVKWMTLSDISTSLHTRPDEFVPCMEEYVQEFITHRAEFSQ